MYVHLWVCEHTHACYSSKFIVSFCVYACIVLYVRMYVCKYVSKYVCMYICMYVCKIMQACMHVGMYTSMQLCACTYARVSACDPWANKQKYAPACVQYGRAMYAKTQKFNCRYAQSTQRFMIMSIIYTWHIPDCKTLLWWACRTGTAREREREGERERDRDRDAGKTTSNTYRHRSSPKP